MAEKDNQFQGVVESLLRGMDTVLSTKTVVGEATQVGDTIILPLVDVTFGVGAGAGNNSQKGSASGAGGLGGKICRIDDLGGNVGCGSLGRFVLRDCGRRGERAFFIFRFFGRLFHLEIFVRCCRRRFYGRSLPARRVIGRFGG